MEKESLLEKFKKQKEKENGRQFMCLDIPTFSILNTEEQVTKTMEDEIKAIINKNYKLKMDNTYEVYCDFINFLTDNNIAKEEDIFVQQKDKNNNNETFILAQPLIKEIGKQPNPLKILFSVHGITTCNPTCSVTNYSAIQLYQNKDFRNKLKTAVETGTTGELTKIIKEYSAQNDKLNNQHENEMICDIHGNQILQKGDKRDLLSGIMQNAVREYNENVQRYNNDKWYRKLFKCLRKKEIQYCEKYGCIGTKEAVLSLEKMDTKQQSHSQIS